MNTIVSGTTIQMAFFDRLSYIEYSGASFLG